MRKLFLAGAALVLATTSAFAFGYDPKWPSSLSLQEVLNVTPPPDMQFAVSTQGMIGAPWIPGATDKQPLGKTGLNVQFDGAGKLVGLDNGKVIVAMGGYCGNCGGGPRGDRNVQGNGLGGNNVLGSGMNLGQAIEHFGYVSNGLSDPHTMDPGASAPVPSDEASQNRAFGAADAAGGSTDASPVGGSAPGGNCNCTDD